MEKMETATNVPVNRNEAAVEAAQEREAASILVLRIKDDERPMAIKLTEMQSFVAMHSIMKKDRDGRMVLYSIEELRKNRDMERPLNHNLQSIKQAYEMLRAAQVCSAYLYFYPDEKDAEPICLDVIQVVVILARLGINLETGRYVTDEVLEVIYGDRWDPELVMDKALIDADALPYTRQNLRAGIRKPKQVKKMLDKTIIGQEEVKEKLATAAYGQEMAARYNRIHGEDKGFVPMRRQYVLLYGKEGSGKTTLLEKLGEATERPVITYDITTLVPPGCQGNSPTELVWELLRKCGGDTAKASRGIICLNNWDRLFGGEAEETMQPIHRQALLAELMQLMDGRNVTFRNDDGEHRLNTGNILFVIGGEFTGLDKIALERTMGKNWKCADEEKSPSIGFICQAADWKEKIPAADENSISPEAPEATLSDLKKYGMPADMLEHLTTVCRVKAPDRNDLVKILANSDSSPVQHYQKMLRMHNVLLQVPEKAMKAAADKAMEQKVGARGLASIFDKVLSPVVFRMAGNRKRMTLRLKPENFTADKVPELLPRNRR